MKALKALILLIICVIAIHSAAISQGCPPINNNNPGNGGTHATICFYNSAGTSLGPCLNCQLTGSGWKCGSAFNPYSGYYSATISGTPCFNAVSLPVDLTAFYAENTPGGIELVWKTASERESNYYEIVRLDTQMQPDSTWKIPAAGNSSTERTYKITDHEPRNGINYYLLQQYDISGKVIAYDPVSIDAGEREITFYPNPVVSGTVRWSFGQTADRILIYAADGRLVDETSASEGSYAFGDMQPSVYLFRVIYPGGKEKNFRIVR